jgi:hypothetical protein
MSATWAIKTVRVHGRGQAHHVDPNGIASCGIRIRDRVYATYHTARRCKQCVKLSKQKP